MPDIQTMVYKATLLLVITTFRPTLMCYCTLITLLQERIGQGHSKFKASLGGIREKRSRGYDRGGRGGGKAGGEAISKPPISHGHLSQLQL